MTITDTKGARAGLVRIDEIECAVTMRLPVLGAHVPSWTQAPPGVQSVMLEARRHVYDFDADTEDFDSDVGEEVTIGRVSAHTVALDRVSSAVMAVDPISEGLSHLAEHADMITAELDESFENVMQVILIETVFIEESYRGQSLGPRILETLVDSVSGHNFNSLVVLQARPVEPWKMSEMDQRRATKKLARMYTDMKYTPHGDDDIFWRYTSHTGPFDQ